MSVTAARVLAERAAGEWGACGRAQPVAVLALHEQLPPVAWAFQRGSAFKGARIGYIQTDGGELDAGVLAGARDLRARGLLCCHVTVGHCHGGELHANTTAQALDVGFSELAWDAAVCGPGPGTIESSLGVDRGDERLGHPGLVALDTAHVALALGCRTLAVARMSVAEVGTPNRGISPQTLTLLDLLLAPVAVALPAGVRSPAGHDLRLAFGMALGAPTGGGKPGPQVARPARIARHDWRRTPVDMVAYSQEGLPIEAMGAHVVDDPLFFAAALAGGSVLAEIVGEAGDE